jgi:excisionase family DNA binding protein
MSSSVQERPLLTLPQVARHLQVSEKTVRRLIGRGLPAVQLGGPGTSVRVDADELRRWLFDEDLSGGFPATVVGSGPETAAVGSLGQPPRQTGGS